MSTEYKLLGFSAAEIKSGPDDEFPGTFEAILSTPTIDRDGEIVDAHAFAPLPDHIGIDLDHEMTARGTVAAGTPWYDEEGVLRFRGKWARDDEAQVIRHRVRDGIISGLSVAFMNAQRETADDGVPHITKGELLNAGIVGIGSNRGALVTSAKAGARNSRADAELIQQIHDHVCSLGAKCAAGDTDPATSDPEKAAAPQEAAAVSPASVLHTALAELALAEAALAD